MFKIFKKKKKAQRYKPKKKMEFSKKWLTACIVVSLFYTTLSYVLAWFDKNTVESVTIELINALWGTSGISFVGYVLQNSVRAYTSSKFGLPDTEKKKSKRNEIEEIIEEDEVIDNG